MHSLSNHLDQPTLDSDFSQLRPPFQAILGPKRTTSLPSISPAPPQPPSATVVAGNCTKQAGSDSFSENLWSSFSFVSQPNRSSKVSGARQNFKRRPPRDRSSSDHLHQEPDRIVKRPSRGRSSSDHLL
ncbi:hypothetical protein Prudu_512S000500 [Prunus dulcis]|uniref:Uncharacterized protein n=1 Tax=Prunus dulcis TaxID=3755 RepID=A0A5H2XXY4_PRUDU|nr:hypothetical protein Prudu_512S000500 [Prunus dulcis]